MRAVALAVFAVTVVCAQAPSSEDATVLSRARAKLSGIGHQLLKYTCTETIDRTFFAPPPPRQGKNILTAPVPGCDPKSKANSTAADRLRLQVAVSDGKEIDAWTSADSFDSRSIHDIVTTGPTSTGAFGTTLADIFENTGTRYHFIGKRNAGKGTIFTYAFEVPLKVSHYMVSVYRGWAATSYHGTFEIDGETADLIRLSVETAELPSQTKACRYNTTTDYHYQTVGESLYLLPTHTQFDVLQRYAGKTSSSAVFSGCHEFRAESSMVFTDDVSATPAATPTRKARPSLPPLPAGLQLTLALLSPVDTGSAAAGDLISARVTKAIYASGSDKVLVAAGAIARGRIVLMRHDIHLGKFWIAIRYQTLEQDGAVMPLMLILDNQLHPDQKEKKTLAKRGDEFALPPQAASGANPGSFTVPAKGRAVLAAGSESKWVTVAQ